MKRVVTLMLAAIITLGCLSGIAYATEIGDFTDVPMSAWYYSNLRYAVAHGMVNGTSDTTFHPNESITRAQFITILYRTFL